MLCPIRMLTLHPLQGLAQFEDPQGRILIHAQGLFALIRKRGAAQFATAMGRQVFMDAFVIFVSPPML
jgi:hypothetical protein